MKSSNIIHGLKTVVFFMMMTFPFFCLGLFSQNATVEEVEIVQDIQPASNASIIELH